MFKILLKDLEYRERRLTEALALLRLLVDEDLGRENVAEGHEHGYEVGVGVGVGQVVDEEVAAVRALDLLRQQAKVVEARRRRRRRHRRRRRCECGESWGKCMTHVRGPRGFSFVLRINR